MASEELERRIQNLIGETKGSISNREMEMFKKATPSSGIQPELQNINNLLNSLGINIADTNVLSSKQKLDLVKTAMEMIGNSKGAISNKEMELFLNSSPSSVPMSSGSMSDQDMNMMIAQQGARQGMSPVEQRAMAFASYLRTTDRTAPEEVVNNYAMGNMSFDDAIQLSQPIQVIDEVTATGQMTPGSGVTDANMISPLDRATLPAKELITNMGIYEPSASDTKLMELQQALRELEAQRQMTNDPEEQELLGRMIENAKTKAFAPQADLVDQLSQGAGEDDMMAHVRSGDINVSREMLENNPALEDAIENAALEVGIDPESMVYGTGIASLNEVTGAEQHGFLKKVAKGIKKVAKVIAPVAAVVPGPWQAPAIAYNRGRAVVNIAKGKGGIGDLMTAAGGFGGDSKIGKFIGDSKIGKAFGESKIGQFFGRTPGINPSAGETGILGGTLGPRMRSGIGKLLGGGEGGSGFFNPAEDATGIFGGSIGPSIRRGIGGLFGGGGQGTATTQEDGSIVYQDAKGNVITKEQYDALMQPRFSGLFGPDSVADKLFNVDPNKGTGPLSFMTDRLPSMPTFRDPETGQLSGMGMLGIGALATGLGKLAYEDTKKDKGVQLTPLNTMNAAGRYNLEAEIARRMGQRAPNPTEFGLLPANTMPQLSGGQPREMMYGGAVEDLEGGMARGMQEGGEVQYPNKGLESLAKVAPDVVKRMGYNMGGQVMMPMNYNMGSRPMMPMAYAKGGNVAVEDFERMNGQINGEGTETSDDVPAMLSDGEFVMTGQAVRGAGSYDMKNDSGIITLSPTGAPSRDGGTDLMYQLMEAFSSQARPA